MKNRIAFGEAETAEKLVAALRKAFGKRYIVCCESDFFIVEADSYCTEFIMGFVAALKAYGLKI